MAAQRALKATVCISRRATGWCNKRSKRHLMATLVYKKAQAYNLKQHRNFGIPRSSVLMSSRKSQEYQTRHSRLVFQATPTPLPEPSFPAFLLSDHRAEEEEDFELTCPPPPPVKYKKIEDTWLTHCCPENPFRARVDINGWHVDMTMEERQRAMDMGYDLADFI